jgi:hypothetical protein
MILAIAECCEQLARWADSRTLSNPASNLCHDARAGHFGRSTMTPQFRSGQNVRISSGLLRHVAAAGEYQIVKQLPEEHGEQQYIIKSAVEPYGRVAKESELERA